MWPEQKPLGPHFFSRNLLGRVLTLGANCARCARGAITVDSAGSRPGSRPDARIANIATRVRARHCAMRISLSATINVHGNPTSESGSRATKLLVTMLTTSPRRSPEVIVQSSTTSPSRCSAQMMNASYVPSLSVVISVVHVDARELQTIIMRVFAHPTILT
jgi:hypothetical protein